MTGNIVSFDIGSAQIKLVWCAGGVCKAAVSAPVPDGLVRGGTIVSMDAMADLLRQLAKENNLQPGSHTVGSGIRPSIGVRRLTLVFRRGIDPKSPSV